MSKNKVEELPRYSFYEGEYVVTLTKEGVKYKKEGEEFTLPYSDVKFYRATSRKRVDDAGREKLYLTAPCSFSTSYNRLCFKENGTTFLTHEFSREEKAEMEAALKEFSVPVIDRRKGAGIAKPPLKTFREDGGITHRIFAISLAVCMAFVLGAVIMYVLHHYLQSDTDTLALVFVIFCLPFLALVIIKSQELGSKIKIYERGVYLVIRSKSGYGGTNSPFAIDKAYFSWEEVECVEHIQTQVQYKVQFRLGYCVYTIPDFNGLYDYISKHFSEKCKEERVEE